MTELYWLPEVPNWRDRLKKLTPESESLWGDAVILAKARLNFVLTNALDEVVRRSSSAPPRDVATQPVRLAVLGSSTMSHLLPSIRIAGLRRDLWIDTFECDYGQYQQALFNQSSALYAFRPTAVLLAEDEHTLTAGVTAAMSLSEAEAALQEVSQRTRAMWHRIQEAFHCPVLHQAALSVHPALLGDNEHRLAGSRAWLPRQLNARLREMADQEGVDILSIDDQAAKHGIRAWYDPGLWHRTKQEVGYAAAPLYGDLVGRWLAAKQGRSFKCLVLDLDNTLWGGVVGDDGIENIQLGQGSPLGEAYAAFQDYARELSRRGIILAVCSKNDEANALEPFDKHPGMVLQRRDIGSFVANWFDKAANLRTIAEELNIGLDSLVFVDDNPFERNLIRQALPMVAVPELPDDPALYPATLADAGYFESLSVTDEDRGRSARYQDNYVRNALKMSSTDLSTYLRSLEMRLIAKPFDRIGLQRIVQLINKSNQFNLTTRRYTDDDVIAVINDPASFGLQLRLLDRFGDNGVIAIVIGRRITADDVLIDTWLMSCRVLGRGVELITLDLIVQEARKLGVQRLLGDYIPTKKNGMVRNHYANLGFTEMEMDQSGVRRAMLNLADHASSESFIHVTVE